MKNVTLQSQPHIGSPLHAPSARGLSVKLFSSNCSSKSRGNVATTDDLVLQLSRFVAVFQHWTHFCQPSTSAHPVPATSPFISSSTVSRCLRYLHSASANRCSRLVCSWTLSQALFSLSISDSVSPTQRRWIRLFRGPGRLSTLNGHITPITH